MDWFETSKVISQVLMFVSGVSALFQELYKADQKTGRRFLTRSGWLHITALTAGLLLFTATELKEKQKADQLKEVLLASYDLAGLEIKLPVEKRSSRIPQSLEQLQLGGSSQPSSADDIDALKDCLIRRMAEAKRHDGGTWILNCYVYSGAGWVKSRALECPPKRYCWEAVEKLLDVLLGRFSIRFDDREHSGGSPFVVFSQESRPREFRATSTELALRVSAPDINIKLSQLLKAKAGITFEIDSHDGKDLPDRIRLRSLDPIATFDQVYEIPRWRPIGYSEGRMVLEWWTTLTVQFDKRLSIGD